MAKGYTYYSPFRARRPVLRAIVLFLTLLVCAALVFVLYRYVRATTSDPDATAPTQVTVSAVDSAQATNPSQPGVTPPVTTGNTVIHFAAAGDLNINDATVKAGGSSYDYTNTFLDVAHLLSGADIAALNFEGNLCGAPYGSTHSAPKTLATALQKAGVDLVQLANSYSINRGLSGLSATIDAFRSVGVEPLGVYADNKAYEEGRGYVIRSVKGIKIAFVAFTKGMDGMTLPAGNENCVNILYDDYDSVYQKVNKKKITAVLTAAKKQQPDLIIAMLHWGSEYNNTVSKTQESIVELMQENGVDAIIGTHSHYVQRINYNPETGQVVAYSLGDFFSSSTEAGTEYSLVLDLEITKDNTTGETKITACTYTPIFTVQEADKPLRVVRLRDAMSAYEQGHIDSVTKETYDKMKYALQRIDARVKGE